jgi:eukaryotic-like serine/threonine-protein kinase
MPKVCPVCGTSYADTNIFCPSDGSTLHAAEAEGDLIGSVVADRYLVTDLLGEGGMGKVYLARHVRLPQQAAIKVLRPAMLRDPAAVARFNREAANASRIEHESIARVFDFGESSDGTVYLAMEYVPGRTLKQLIANDGPLSPERTARLTRQVADALDAAHRLGIVHRDLKPDNVMVIEDSELGDRCKVVDFGIAKAVGGDAGEPGLTKTGFVVGTPEFMSPEQLMGGAIDHRSDVYALGLLSFQCLTGSLPFDSSTPERAMTGRLIDAPQPLAAAMPSVAWPPALQGVFDRALARDPNDRVASAGAFARELAAAVQEWQGGAGLSAVVGATSATADPALRHAETVATPSRGATTVSQGGTRAAAPEPRVATVRTPAHTPTHSPSRVPLLVTGLVGAVAVAGVAFMMLRGGDEGTPADRSPAEPPQVVSVTPPAQTVQQPADTLSAAASADVPSASTARETDQQQATEATPTRQNRPNQPSGEARTPQTPAEPTTTLTTGAAARITLDSIKLSLDPLTATPAEARRVVGALRSLMPRLTTAEDSAWGYIREAEAHFLTGDERSACLALRTAEPLARTSGQRAVLVTLTPAC